MVVGSFVGFLFFKACGENVISEEHCQWLSSVEETWPVIVLLKCPLLDDNKSSAAMQHFSAAYHNSFCKSCIIRHVLRKRETDTTQCSGLSHVTLPSIQRETGSLWLFVLRKGSTSTWKVTLSFMCFFLCAFSLQHPFSEHFN